MQWLATASCRNKGHGYILETKQLSTDGWKPNLLARLFVARPTAAAFFEKSLDIEYFEKINSSELKL